MSEWMPELLGVLMNLFEGYCIGFFFGSFTEPKLRGLRSADWMAGMLWIVMRIPSRIFFPETNGAALVLKLLFSFVVLFGFCLVWYRGNLSLKIFLVVQFIALRELAFFAGYSFMYIGGKLLDLLVKVYNSGGYQISAGEFLVAADILAWFSIVFMEAIQGVLLFFSIKKIVGSYHAEEKGRMDREVVFYLLPGLAGVLVAVLVRLSMIEVTEGIPVLLYEKHPALYLIIPLLALVLLGAIVCSFRMYQDMAALQEERAERIVLENQITQMQSSMMEMAHLYDGVRAVRHDIKNHMAVLQNLIRKRYPQDDGKQDEEIRHYFEDMQQAAEQIEMQVNTGNAVSDAVIGSKFRYAAGQIEGISLNADDFFPPGEAAVRAYDMGIILNNGLDNAIEACMRMRKKSPDAEPYIKLRSFRAKNMYFIEIENSFDGTVRFREENGLPISMKEDKEVHGIGLKNIRKCAVKYGGDMDCIVKEGKFILSVMVKG